jgi:dUTP pyrophosphatase
MKIMLSPGAFAPTRGSAGAAGYDLYANEDVTIGEIDFTPVNTGVSVAIPPGYYGRIAPRSGLAAKYGIIIGGGVIDEDYRGELKVLMSCLFGIYDVSCGERIAQLILEKITTPELDIVTSLDDTDRGSDGFGSTGK